jgi:hypothetical protein
LREADERAGGRIQQSERSEENAEARRARQKSRPEAERDPAAQHDRAPKAAIGEQAEGWLDEQRDDPRQRKRQPDLDVAEPEVVPDLRPGCLARAVEKLVEELDGEQ